MVEKEPDYELIKLCQNPASDRFEEAFTLLYEKYKDRVYNIAWRVVGNHSEALDICQETFTLLLKKISTFHFESKFSSWLYRIVVNMAIDYQRKYRHKHKKEVSLPSDSQGAGIKDEKTANPGQKILETETEQMVHNAIASLSPKLRAIVVLRYLEGMSYEELSEILDVSLGTVKSRLARAHVVLAKKLGPYLQRRKKNK